MASVTSYGIVCATSWRAPISAYFELEAQPDHRIEWTARLDIASINSTPRFMLMRGYGMGRGLHTVRALLPSPQGALSGPQRNHHGGAGDGRKVL